MIPIKCSSTLEIYEPGKSNMFGHLNRWTDCGSVYASASISAVEPICYNLSLSDNKERIRTRQTVRYYGFCDDYRPNNLHKAFVFGSNFASFTYCPCSTSGHHLNTFSRTKHTKFSRMKGAARVQSTSDLDQGVKLTNAAMVSESMDMDSPASASVKGSRGKHWAQVAGQKKRTAQAKDVRPDLRKNANTRIYKRVHEDAVSLSDFELDDAISAIGPSSSIEQCNSLLKLLEESNGEKALSFFQWMKSNGKLKENITAYNLALRVLGRQEDWKSAETLLQELIVDAGCKLSFQVYNTLIYACNKRGLTEWGTKWFHMMLENGVRPNLATFGMLMSLYQKGGNLADAEFTFCQMRNCKVHCLAAYSAMITIYTRLGLYDKSEEIINIMKEDKVLPNLENWLVRLNAYCQRGKMEEAELVLMSMQKAGVSPNIIAYNTLITGYGKVGNMDAAQRAFQSLQIMGLEPDETTYRSMIEGFGRTDNYKKALWYYKELKQSGFHPNSSNFYTIINLQAENKDEEGAIEITKDMKVMGCQYSSILSSLLQAYEKVGRIHKVPFILKASFYDKILHDQACCSILSMAYVQHNLVDQALSVLQDKHWTDQNFEDHLYHLLICSCKDAGRYEDAVRIFSQISNSKTNTNLHIVCSMIDIYTIMGRFDDGEGLYLKLQALGVALDMVTYNVVVRMYIKCASLKDACLVLDTMEKKKDIMPDTYLFRDMLRIYQQCNMHEKLMDVYSKMLKSGVTWDEAMYNCVINCCARALPVDEISRLFNEMLQQGFIPNTVTFNVMLDVYGKSGLMKKARKVFWMARKHHQADAISYNTIIAAYGQNKDLKNMISTYRRMKYAGMPVPLEAYNSMLDAYGKENQIEKFNDVLQYMKESSCDSDHYTYNIMINIYGKKGWIEEVATVLAQLKERGLKPDLCSYNSLIKAYGFAGMVEEAVSIVKEMRENGIEPDRVTYVNLIWALQTNDNFLEAVKWSLWMKQLGIASSNC